jgi:hypothetical protein
MGLPENYNSMHIKKEKKVTKIKSLPIEWEKIFCSKSMDKLLVCTIFKELKNLNSKKTNDQINKWAKELNRSFSEEEIQMSKKYIKKFSTSSAITIDKSKLHYDTMPPV